MNYRRADHRRNPRHFSWSLVILAATLLGIYFFGGTLSAWLYSPLELISRPVLFVARELTDGFGAIGQFIRFKNNLIADNEKLAQENTRLKNLQLANRLVEQENVELKKLVGLRDQKNAPILVEVLAKPIATPHDILLVDLGDIKTKTVKVGDLVGSGGGAILLGQVAAVYRQSAKLKLFSSFGDQIAVSVGPNHLPGIAKGLGSGNFSLALPRGTKIAVGDTVTASSYHDMLLGSVGAVQAASADPYLRVLFRMPVNLYELKWVEIYEQ